jgi:hypothetical protein
MTSFRFAGRAVRSRDINFDSLVLPSGIADGPLFLPPRVQDFVAEDHLARFVLSLVRDDLDLIEISGTYLERHEPARLAHSISSRPLPLTRGRHQRY